MVVTVCLRQCASFETTLASNGLSVLQAFLCFKLRSESWRESRKTNLNKDQPQRSVRIVRYLFPRGSQSERNTRNYRRQSK